MDRDSSPDDEDSVGWYGHSLILDQMVVSRSFHVLTQSSGYDTARKTQVLHVCHTSSYKHHKREVWHHA